MEGKIIVRYIIMVSVLAIWVHSVSGCGSCRGCGGPDMSLPQAGAADCVTPCGVEVWFGEFGPANCSKINMAERASLDCIGNYVYGGGKTADPGRFCSGLKGSYLLLNDAPMPPYGQTWIPGPRIAVEVFNGSDWRVNSWAHETMGHVVQYIFTGDSDHDHMNFYKGPGGVFDAMGCTQNLIVRNWRL